MTGSIEKIIEFVGANLGAGGTIAAAGMLLAQGHFISKLYIRQHGRIITLACYNPATIKGSPSGFWSIHELRPAHPYLQSYHNGDRVDPARIRACLDSLPF